MDFPASPPGQEEETNLSPEAPPVVELAPSPPGQQEVEETPPPEKPDTVRVNLLDRILPKPTEKSKYKYKLSCGGLN